MRVRNGMLYTVDAYLGLFKVDITTGARLNLFKASEPMPDGYPTKFLNDIEVDDDGRIYVTDSSYKYQRENHPYVGFEGTTLSSTI